HGYASSPVARGGWACAPPRRAAPTPTGGTPRSRPRPGRMWKEPAPTPPPGTTPLREGAPMTPAEPVTDAHLHLWDLAASSYAWLAGAPEALRRTVDIDDVREGLEELDVTRVVLVQADDTDEDTAHLQTTARDIEEHAQRTGTGIARADVVGWLPLTDPDAVRDALADPRRTDHL